MKLEINDRRKFGKGKIFLEIINIHLNNQWVPEEIIEEANIFLKFNDNDYTSQLKLSDTLKTVQKAKFIARNVHIR